MLAGECCGQRVDSNCEEVLVLGVFQGLYCSTGCKRRERDAWGREIAMGAIRKRDIGRILVALTLVATLALGGAFLQPILSTGDSARAFAAQPQKKTAKPKLSTTKKTIYKGQTKVLKVKNASGKVKWKSSNKKVATVNSYGQVTGKKKGKATITATVNGKKLKCRVTVKEISKAQREKVAKQYAKKIVKKYTSSKMTRLEKAHALFLYLIGTTHSQLNQSTSAYKQNYGNEAYGALVSGKAACSGFCRAYTMLCKEAGIPVRHINANKWTHQWNEIKIGKKWYMVDTQGHVVEYTTEKIRPFVEAQFPPYSDKEVCSSCNKIFEGSLWDHYSESPKCDKRSKGQSSVINGSHTLGWDSCPACKKFTTERVNAIRIF